MHILWIWNYKDWWHFLNCIWRFEELQIAVVCHGLYLVTDRITDSLSHGVRSCRHKHTSDSLAKFKDKYPVSWAHVIWDWVERFILFYRIGWTFPQVFELTSLMDTRLFSSSLRSSSFHCRSAIITPACKPMSHLWRESHEKHVRDSHYCMRGSTNEIPVR